MDNQLVTLYISRKLFLSLLFESVCVGGYDWQFKKLSNTCTIKSVTLYLFVNSHCSPCLLQILISFPGASWLAREAHICNIHFLAIGLQNQCGERFRVHAVAYLKARSRFFTVKEKQCLSSVHREWISLTAVHNLTAFRLLYQIADGQYMPQ